MSVIENLQQGSFAGINFLVRSEREEGGKKIASHEYPNSNKRFTEPLGTVPPKFNLEVVIHGNDAINERFRLIQALQKPGLETLVHPVNGAIQVESTTFTVNSNQTRIGEFLFSINFETSQPNVTPVPVAVDSFTVSKSADDTREALDNVIGDSYQEPTFGDSLNAAADKITEISQDISKQINNVRDPIQKNVDSFTRVTNAVDATIFTIVQQKNTVQSSLTALYSAFLSIANTPSDLLAAWQDLIDFDIDSSTQPTNTFQRQQIANNINILNEHTRLTALASAYESVSYIEFTTDEQLLELQKFLDDQYDLLLRDSISDVSVSDTTVVALDPDVRSTFATLRDNARKTLDQLKENVWRVVDIDRLKSSMALTSYRYYGSLDNLELLASLNPGVNSSGFDQSIKGVTK